MPRNYSFDKRCDKERIEAKLCMYLVTPRMCFIVYNTILFLFLSASFVTGVDNRFLSSMRNLSLYIYKLRLPVGLGKIVFRLCFYIGFLAINTLNI